MDMKNSNLLLLTLLISTFLCFTSCDDDEKEPVVPEDPTITLASTSITGVKADSLRITATISHPIGIKTIQLNQADWGVSETIDLTSDQPTSYSLNTKAYIPFIEGTVFNVTITAISADLTQTQETLEVTVAEPKMFLVGTGYPDFPKVKWSTQVDSVLPMMETSDGVFKVFNLKVNEGAEMKFIGQTGAWAPKNYGWSMKTADESFTMLNDEGSGVFIFKKGGTYDITFNETALTCEVSAISQDDANITSLYILGNGLKTTDGLDFSQSWWDDGSLSQPLTETSAGSGIYEISVVFDEVSIITSDNYDSWGCYFYFATDDAWSNPYGILGGHLIDGDYYVSDPSIAGGNTFDFVPDLNGNWDMYVYYLESYIAGGNGTFKITVNTQEMTCNVAKQ